MTTKNFNCRTTRLATFPDYLMVQIKKFTLGDDWVPKKLGKILSVRSCKQCMQKCCHSYIFLMIVKNTVDPEIFAGT